MDFSPQHKVNQGCVSAPALSLCAIVDLNERALERGSTSANTSAFILPKLPGLYGLLLGTKHTGT